MREDSVSAGEDAMQCHEGFAERVKLRRVGRKALEVGYTVEVLVKGLQQLGAGVDALLKGGVHLVSTTRGRPNEAAPAAYVHSLEHNFLSLLAPALRNP